ncbi:hypothetical protein C1N74_07075 [Microbacterium sp. SGAir0570]|jgi:ABC-type Fe3+ transport system permease subunit|uniref:hypothetical protein n=1 Tax=Microbacterium sp. SGAir0570 TaxID=2070348 RepID=UPI0010CCFD30|nr:hypothetical protein [Microbacterium sp. SGAir0570]QCR40205.1 hypothetical protein C1N74_07075 [Microbacterium sp. SGAir0570]
MQIITAGLLVAWALAVVIASTLGVRGRYETASINGMRRRRADASDTAWRAGLRALYPWMLTSAALLLFLALAVLLSSPGAPYLLLLLGLAFVLGSVFVGIGALNRAVRRQQEAESAERGLGVPPKKR